MHWRDPVSTDLTTPIPIGDILRTRVRDAIANAIPDEQMDEFIRREIDGFTRSIPSRDTWAAPIPSPLAQLIRAELAEQFKPAIKAKVAEKLGQWSGGDADKLVEDLAKEMAPKVMTELMTGIVGHALLALRSGATNY